MNYEDIKRKIKKLKAIEMRFRAERAKCPLTKNLLLAKYKVMTARAKHSRP